MTYKEYDEKDLQSFEYETTIQSDGKIIGVCELGKATIQMINDSNNYSAYKESWIKTVHGSFFVYDVSPVQEKVNIKLECYDIKYKLDTKYDKTKHIFPTTLKAWRNSIFEDCGLTYDNSDFPNGNLILTEQPYLEEGCTNRDVIKMIAEAGCSTVTCDNEDVVYFKWFDDIIEPYEAMDWLELTTEKVKSPIINTVVLGRGDTEDNVYYPNPKPITPNEFRIDNNYILDPQEVDSDEDKRYDVIQDIYDRVNGFSYLIFNLRTQSINNKLSIKLGQRIKYKDIWNNELIAYVMSRKITWLGGSLEQDDNYEITLSAEEIKETSTNLDYSSNIKKSLLEVTRKTDKNSGQIEDLVQQNSEFSEKMTNVSQTVNEISQTVNDIEKLEREINGTNYILIENAMQGRLQELIIEGPIDLLYPNEELYPIDNLYPLDSYLIVDKARNLTSDAKKIYLPILDLKENEKLVLNPTNCYIIRQNNIIEQIDYIDIELFDGLNYIYLESFQDNNIKMSAKYVIKNNYTEMFATKVEMNSSINQTADEINLKVSKKISNNDGGVELASLIRQTAELIFLEANNFGWESANSSMTVDGKITATSGKIGGFELEKDLFHVHIKDAYVYTKEDAARIVEIADGSPATDEEKVKYDLNDDGIIDRLDSLAVLRKINGYESTEGDFYLCSNDPRYFIKTTGNASKSLHTKIGLTMMQTSNFTAQNATFQNRDDSLIQTNISGGSISCVTLNQTSLASKKKNFELYENALDEVKKIDIYKYNLKHENDDSKKHLGFVIGDAFNYSKIVTNDDNTGVDIYSFASLCVQAVKEQQIEIEQLKCEINELREMIKNGL